MTRRTVPDRVGSVVGALVPLGAREPFRGETVEESVNLLRLCRRMRALLTGRVELPPHIVLGANVHLGVGVLLDMCHGHLITIEDDAVIATGTRILTHDSAGNRRNGLTWVAPVRVGRRAFVGADSLILPGVTIGPDAIVAAGSVVVDDVASHTVVAGTPARVIGTVADFDSKRANDARPVFDRSVYNRWPLEVKRLQELDEAAAAGGYYFGPSSRPVRVEAESSLVKAIIPDQMVDTASPSPTTEGETGGQSCEQQSRPPR